ncbi:hypothetical protein O1157_33955 [Streptomyces albogriseolus]
MVVRPTAATSGTPKTTWGTAVDDRPQQRLARFARPVGALPAEQFTLDDHGGQARGVDPLGHVLADGAPADDDHVVLTDAAARRCFVHH